MAEVTVRVPEELKRKMEQFPRVDWSGVAQTALWARAHQLAFMEEFTRRSRMTERGALELGRKINRAVARRYREAR